MYILRYSCIHIVLNYLHYIDSGPYYGLVHIVLGTEMYIMVGFLYSYFVDDMLPVDAIRVVIYDLSRKLNW